MSTVTCHNLYKSFGNLPVVQDVSLSVPPGKILVLLGPSGCGKTTTLRLIAGFERLDDGRIEIDSQLVADASHHVPPEKRRTGIVFQDYAIFPHLNVFQNIAFGLRKDRLPTEELEKRVNDALSLIEMAGYYAAKE